MTVSDHILLVVLSLLKKEVPEHSRHLPQYFHFFISYSNLGPAEVMMMVVVVAAVVMVGFILTEGCTFIVMCLLLIKGMSLKWMLKIFPDFIHSLMIWSFNHSVVA